VYKIKNDSRVTPLGRLLRKLDRSHLSRVEELSSTHAAMAGGQLPRLSIKTGTLKPKVSMLSAVARSVSCEAEDFADQNSETLTADSPQTENAEPYFTYPFPSHMARCSDVFFNHAREILVQINAGN